MAKRAVNHRWSQGLGAIECAAAPSEFEQVVEDLRLSPAEYETSPQLRMWVEKNWRQKFVPEKLCNQLTPALSAATGTAREA